MGNQSLPAVDRLGYAIDVTSITPMDISSVDNAVVTIRRLINIDLEKVYSVTIENMTYDVPKSVSVLDDGSTTEGIFIYYPNGPEASAAFRADASLSMRYFALHGGSSTVEATQKSFVRDKQYAFFSFAKNKYSARLQNYADSLNKQDLLKGVKDLPTPFDGKNADTLKLYKRFFERYGSHIIISTNYGSRYPLKTWGSNQDATVNKMFTTDVKAAFSGIPEGGKFDATVMDQDQYKTFLGYLQKFISVSGGDQTIANKLANNTATYEEYEKWTNSTDSSRASLLSFRVIELWNLMSLSSEDTLVNYADQLSTAFSFIITNPEVFKTPVTLDIQTDWAEFNLLTPSAVIVPDLDKPYPTGNTVASDTRVQWGKEYSHAYERQTLHFFVINDGSPIDFSISHGSESSGGATGEAQVIMERNSYINKDITDDVWNTAWYYRSPVAPNPVSTSRSAQQSVQRATAWDATLCDHLVEIGMKSLSVGL
ncbi:hypothetical protein K503DRAFT_772166 [Rhizopogon vinicolor AM-OR11-026]|uniref:MACPF domain-containing protein n=1 Tax=Rhizopogon vinicolor AM-OR11-026 TaxID=1314800 RepID=A0A1B7MW49_9AGAM|nr:hypothetical protein K503DRAFT_772166 [Rhizopogon vinicolor AM-OR11-026]